MIERDWGASVVVVGLGNIGACAAALVARSCGVQHLTVVDRDVYEVKNLASQDIVPEHVGRAKALVQGERLCGINPALRVTAVVEDVAHAPLGLLRGTVLLAGLDSRRARQSVSQAAWRLGMPWIDAGVRADGSLARINVYRPGDDEACLECAWDQRDYDLIEQTAPCLGALPAPAATNAPASLGALAAALQVLECQKVLAGDWARVAAGRQVLIDAASHRHFVTSIRRTPMCRFDHRVWQIERVAASVRDLRIGAVLRLAPGGCAGLRIDGQAFVRALVCPRCGVRQARSWGLSGRLGAERICPQCRRPMLAPGEDTRVWLVAADVSPERLDDPLCSLGVRDGDVVSVGDAGDARYIEVGARAVERDDRPVDAPAGANASLMEG